MGWPARRLPPPLPGSLDAFTLLLAPNVTTNSNTHICKRCYNIHRRPSSDPSGRTRITPPTPPDAFLELCAAANSLSSSPSANSSSPPPFSASPPFSPPPLPPPSPPPSSAPRPLSDINNTPLKQRRHSTPLKRKRELVEAAAALSIPQQRAQFCAREGVDSRVLRGMNNRMRHGSNHNNVFTCSRRSLLCAHL